MALTPTSNPHPKRYWGSALNQLAKAVGDCHLLQELQFVQHEGNLLGFGKVSGAASVLVHGLELFTDLDGAFVAFEGHDYRQAGSELSTVMKTLDGWTGRNLCSSDACYIVGGM